MQVDLGFWNVTKGSYKESSRSQRKPGPGKAAGEIADS
jgi:hypothetical protein